MRISQIVCSLEAGGAESFVSDLSLALARRGHEIDVLTIDRFTGKEFEREQARRLAEAGIRLRSLGRRAGSRVQALASSYRLWSANQRRRYDVLHSHLSMPDAITCLVRACTPWPVRHVATVHSTRQRWDPVTARLLRKCRIVYCSEPVAASVAPILGLGKVVPNGVDLTRFGFDDANRSSLRRSFACGRAARVVASVSSLGAGKNLADALRAAKTLCVRRPDIDLHYLICGDGAERKNLEKLAKDLSMDERVRFLGVRTDVADILKAADAFVSASLYEGMPISVLEALAAGIPCALSPIAEHESAARGMAGCFVAASPAPEALAEAMGAALDLPLSHRELLDRRRERLSRFSIENAAAEYEKVYEAT